MSSGRKYRRCPHCKGKTGFLVTVYLGGYEESKVTFNGKIIDQKRSGTDDIENRVECLDCGKFIETEKVETSNV